MADRPTIREVTLASLSPFEIVVFLPRILSTISWLIKTEQELRLESAVDMVSARRLIQISPFRNGCMLPIICFQTSSVAKSGASTKTAIPTKTIKIMITKRSTLVYRKTLLACIGLEAI